VCSSGPPLGWRRSSSSSSAPMQGMRRMHGSAKDCGSQDGLGRQELVSVRDGGGQDVLRRQELERRPLLFSSSSSSSRGSRGRKCQGLVLLEGAGCRVLAATSLIWLESVSCVCRWCSPCACCNCAPCALSAAGCVCLWLQDRAGFAGITCTHFAEESSEARPVCMVLLFEVHTPWLAAGRDFVFDRSCCFGPQAHRARGRSCHMNHASCLCV